MQLYKNEYNKGNIKNWTYYFYNDIINIENFDAKLLKIDKKSYKDIDIYNIGYVTKKKIDNCKNINSANPLYLGITRVNGYIEEKDSNKYLVFDSTDENKELLKNIVMFLMELWVKLEKLMMIGLNIQKTTWKLNLVQMIIYH